MPNNPGHVQYVDLSSIPGVEIDLRYAGINNFTGADVYGDFRRALLHVKAADKLRAAAARLQTDYPGCRLLVFDAARPHSAQIKLWDKVKGTDMQNYIANPAKTSIHSYGFAVDLTVLGADGKELDMGTAYDTLDALSQPALEERFLKEGRLTPAQVRNRLLLRELMLGAGFTQLPTEWWHYEAERAEVVRRDYPLIE